MNAIATAAAAQNKATVRKCIVNADLNETSHTLNVRADLLLTNGDRMTDQHKRDFKWAVETVAARSHLRIEEVAPIEFNLSEVLTSNSARWLINQICLLAVERAMQRQIAPGGVLEFDSGALDFTSN